MRQSTLISVLLIFLYILGNIEAIGKIYNRVFRKKQVRSSDKATERDSDSESHEMEFWNLGMYQQDAMWWSKKVEQNIDDLRNSLATEFIKIYKEHCLGSAFNTCDLFAHAEKLSLRSIFKRDVEKLLQIDSSQLASSEPAIITIYGLEKNYDLESYLVQSKSHYNFYGNNFVGIEKHQKFQLYLLAQGVEGGSSALFYAEIFYYYIRDALSAFFNKPAASKAFNLEIVRQLVEFVEGRLNLIPLPGRVTLSLGVLIPSLRKFFVHKLGASRIGLVRKRELSEMIAEVKENSYGLTKAEFENILQLSMNPSHGSKTFVTKKSVTFGKFFEFKFQSNDRIIFTSDAFYKYLAKAQGYESKEGWESRAEAKMVNLNSSTISESFIEAKRANTQIYDEFSLILIDIVQN